MEMDCIVARLNEMKSCCDIEINAEACAEAADVIFALMDGGFKTAAEAKDLVHDYNALAKQYQAMYKRHGFAGRAIHKDGVWHCPACNHRVNPGHSFCHSCGKKLEWGIYKRGGRR